MDQESKDSTILMDHPEIITHRREVVAKRKEISMRREVLLKKCTMSVLLANLEILDRIIDKDLPAKASEEEEASFLEEVNIDLVEAISIPKEEVANSDLAEVDHPEREEEMTKAVLLKGSIEHKWAALLEEIAAS